MSTPDPAAHIDEAYARTEARVRELSAALAAMIESSDTANLDDEHDPEGPTVGFERAQVAALLDQARTRLSELERARRRLALGDYGFCATCGRVIPDARLEAQPATENCVVCAAVGEPARHRPGAAR